MLGMPKTAGQAWPRLRLLALLALLCLVLLGRLPSLGTRTGAAPTVGPFPEMRFPWPADLHVWYTSGPHDGSYGIGSTSAPLATRNALDFSIGKAGWPVLAAAGGTVVRAGCYLDRSEGLGCITEIDHGDGWQTIYAHLRKDPRQDVGIEIGDDVPRGALIGRAGETGHAYGAHLHFELRTGGHREDGKWVFGEETTIHNRVIDGWTIKASRRNYEGTAVRKGEPTRTSTSSCFWSSGVRCARNDLPSTNELDSSERFGEATAIVGVGMDDGHRIFAGSHDGGYMAVVGTDGKLVESHDLSADGVPDADLDGSSLVAAWWNPGHQHIEVQVVSRKGTVERTIELPASPRPGGRVSVAADGAGGYFAAWSAPTSGDGGDIFGIDFDIDGRLGKLRRVDDRPGLQAAPDVVYDAQAARYVVVWADSDRGAIAGRTVAAHGSMSRPFQISGRDVGAAAPVLATSGTRVLVAWQQRGRHADVFVRSVERGGPAGPSLAIATSGDDETAPTLAWDPQKQRFGVAWLNGRRAGTDVAWRTLDPRGTPVGGAATLGGDGDATALAISCTRGSCLVSAIRNRRVVSEIVELH